MEPAFLDWLWTYCTKQGSTASCLPTGVEGWAQMLDGSIMAEQGEVVERYQVQRQLVINAVANQVADFF